MKKVMLSTLALCLPVCVQAVPGNVNLVRKDGAVTRTLEVSEWKVDKRGVPTFDYRYKQSGPNCAYARDGHAIAQFQDNGDSVELVVFNPQDANGKETAPIMFFSDRDNTGIFFEVSQSKKGKFDWMSFSDPAMKKTTPKVCGFTEKGTSVMFKNK